MIKPEYGGECVCGGKRIKGRDQGKRMGRLVVRRGLLTHSAHWEQGGVIRPWRDRGDLGRQGPCPKRAQNPSMLKQALSLKV